MRMNPCCSSILLGLVFLVSTGCATVDPYPDGDPADPSGGGAGGQGAGGSESGGGAGAPAESCDKHGDVELCGNGIDDDCDDSTDDPSRCVLQDEALVARYFITEGLLGGNVSKLADAGPDMEVPLNTFALGEGELTAPGVGGHGGFSWKSAGSAARALAGTDNTKIRDRLNEKTQATIEVVVSIEDVASGGSPISWIGPGKTGQLSLVADDTSSASLYFNGTAAGQWTVDFKTLQRFVLHLVVNTTLSPSGDWARIYVNGMPAEPTAGGSPPSMGSLITIDEGSSYALGNIGDPGRNLSFRGTLFYAALYDAALSEEAIKNNAAVLLDNDDGHWPL